MIIAISILLATMTIIIMHCHQNHYHDSQHHCHQNHDDHHHMLRDWKGGVGVITQTMTYCCGHLLNTKYKIQKIKTENIPNTNKQKRRHIKYKE